MARNGKLKGSISRFPQQSLPSGQYGAQWKESYPAVELIPYHDIWAVYPVLDAVYYARDCHKTLHEIEYLVNVEGGHGLWFDVPLSESEQWIPATFALSSDYLDPDTLVFRLYRADEPSAYAVDIGLRIITTQGGFIPSGIGSRWEQVVANCLHFLEQIAPAGKWGFPAREHERVSVFATYAALAAVRTALLYVGKSALPPKLRRHLNLPDAATALDEVTVSNSNMFAFRNASTDGAHLPTTYHAYQVAALLRSLDLDTSLNSSLSSKSLRTLNFVRSCWNHDTGGFKGSPDEAAPASIEHTRSGLQLLRTLMSTGDISRADTLWLDLTKVFDFVTSRYVDGAFVDTTGDEVPSLCTTRTALSVLKQVALLQLNGVGIRTIDASGLGSWLTEASRYVAAFVEACTDRAAGVCYAYPIRALPDHGNSPVTTEQRGFADVCDNGGQDVASLLQDVLSIRPGDEGAKLYERAIEQLLSLLFAPALAFPELETKIHGGRKRIDITYLNAANDGFFHWLRDGFAAPYIIVECKNYKADPANPELDQLIGRFSGRRGKVGLLVCRTLANKDLFIQRCRDAAIDDHGYVIPLDDEDLRTLASERQRMGRLPLFPSVLVDRFRRLVM